MSKNKQVKVLERIRRGKAVWLVCTCSTGYDDAKHAKGCPCHNTAKAAQGGNDG